MKATLDYIQDFRDSRLARRIAARIRGESDALREYHFMEFCGGHTHAIARYGIGDLLPTNIHLIHGPGCPVCVLPIGRLDQAIALALQHDVILCTYGDCLRVPASRGMSLMKARAAGAEVRMVYCAADALQAARNNPARQVVFFAIGFETTTPPTALVIKQAEQEGLENFSVLCCHVLTPSAMGHILNAPGTGGPDHGPTLDGFIGPAHVSVIIGSQPYRAFTREHGKPVVIAGFEPLDVLQSILMLICQVNRGQHELQNEFTRAVSAQGNLAAQAVMAEVFCLRESFEWRGLGELPESALRLKDELAHLDAEKRFAIPYKPVADHKRCLCAAILRGLKQPPDCPLFGTACTPEHAMGSCMVSSEGACAAYYSYGPWRGEAVRDAAIRIAAKAPL